MFAVHFKKKKKKKLFMKKFTFAILSVHRASHVMVALYNEVECSSHRGHPHITGQPLLHQT